MSSDRNSVFSVEKAMLLLRELGRTPYEYTVAELATVTGFSASSVYRIMRALEKSRAVHRDKVTGKHCLGPLAGDLGRAADTYSGLRVAAAPLLAQLHSFSGETVSLHVKNGPINFMCIDTVQGDAISSFIETVYSPIPLGRGAASLVFLAGAGERYGHQAVGHFLARLPEKQRPFSIERMLTKVGMVQEDGIAQSEHTRMTGQLAHSTWVRGADDAIVGALTLSAPVNRKESAQIQSWISELRVASSRISDRYASQTKSANNPILAHA